VRSDLVYDVATNGRWGRWLLSVPTFIVTNSESAFSSVARTIRVPAAVKVLRNVLDLDEFDRLAERKADQKSATDTVRAVVVGSLIPTKRVDLFLRALGKARRSGQSLEGIVVGDGPEKARLEGLAYDLGLVPDGVTFMGRRDDVPRLLAESDVLVLASDHEGFPNVLLEGMAARLPVVTTPAGDAPQLVRNGVSGYVVPFDDPQAMAARLVELASATHLRERMGREGRRIVEEKYSWVELGPKVLSLYAEVLGRGSQSLPPGRPGR
jgi:glycosyltransferase involved in cell wall biosynthesis